MFLRYSNMGSLRQLCSASRGPPENVRNISGVLTFKRHKSNKIQNEKLEKMSPIDIEFHPGLPCEPHNMEAVRVQTQ